MLNKLGYHDIHSANNGREALDSIEQTNYDLVFMDMQMPVMDGYQATAALREREQNMEAATNSTATPHMPIIALTANAIVPEEPANMQYFPMVVLPDIPTRPAMAVCAPTCTL